MKILFLCLNLQDSGLKMVPPLQFLLLRIACGAFFDKAPKIAHHHLCLNIFKGKSLISILKIWV